MARFQGEVTFRSLVVPAEPFAIKVQGAWRTLAASGLNLAWDPRHAEFDFRDGVLALAVGRARDPSGNGRGEAARWIDRYARLGDAMAEHVGGGFAVAIVDCRRRKGLLCVDRFGIEPLCYGTSPDRLTFADTACDVPGSMRQLDSQSVFDYLFFHVIPAPQTIFGDVLRLEAAHRLVATEASAQASRYWIRHFVEDDHTRLRERMHEFIEAVRHAVDEEADEPSTACFLSGGTDSSTVAGMLTRLRGEPAHAYSIGFEAEGYDEMAYARIAARHFGLVHHEYYLAVDDLVAAIPKVAASVDQPFGNSSILPAYFCAAKAHEDGFTRMLAGDGGDELFGGNSRYAVQNAFEAYHALPRVLREGALEPLADTMPFRRVPLLRQMGGYVRHAKPVMPGRLNAFNLLEYIGLENLFEPEFLSRVNPAAPLEQQRAAWGRSASHSVINRMLEYDWKFTLADSDLHKVRSATQLAGVTVGYPLLSLRLTDLSLRLPPDWKVRRMTLRWFFKRALRDFLPKEILRKKKHGFGLPFGTWLGRHQPLHALAEEALDGLMGRGVIRPGFSVGLLRDRLPSAPAFFGELVWILMMLELWLRAHEIRAVPAGDHDGSRFAQLVADGSS
jgi:asparagine synthase (glutamine-hydrolysing)